MARVWVDYLIAIGWGVVGAVSMACGLAILLKVFDWLTPLDEWEEVRKGNISVAIILASVILALGIAIGFAIMPVPAARQVAPQARAPAPRGRVMAKRCPPAKPADQLELGSAPVEETPPARANSSKPLPGGQVETVARRAVARRGVDATGHVQIAVTISRTAAEALSARAIQETRNFEDVAAEIPEREAGAD